MSGTDQAALLDALRQYLRTIQKPGVSVDSLGLDDPLVASGLLDSLAIMQIVVWLEEHYGIDFAAGGFDPERLATMGSIVELIAQDRA
jgi:acyl carrier protein